MLAAKIQKVAVEPVVRNRILVTFVIISRDTVSCSDETPLAAAFVPVCHSYSDELKHFNQEGT